MGQFPTLNRPASRFNPALRLYERLGFRQIDDRGVYLFMEWRGEGQADKGKGRKGQGETGCDESGDAWLDGGGDGHLK